MKLHSVKVIGSNEMPVLVKETGVATNRYVDGTAGVPEWLRQMAEEAFDPEDDPVVGEE